MNSEIGVPNGGWGWLVVAGTALINVCNQAYSSMFGLIFGPKLEKLAGTTGIATVLSIHCTVVNFSGFLISPMTKYFSLRQITQIAVLLSASGLAISSYTNSYLQITLGYGLLTGTGFGLISSATFLIINSYFDKQKKSQAVGFSMAGTSVGQMMFPPIVVLFLENFGYSGTVLILSALSLNGLVGAMFFHPVEQHMKKNDRQCEGLLEKQGKPTIDEKSDNPKDEEDQSKWSEPKGCFKKFVDLFNFQILLDPIFLHLIVGLSFSYSSNTLFSTFFPLFLTEDLDISLINASSCMSTLSLLDFLGRLLIPMITKHIDCSNRTIFIIGALVLAISRTFLILQTKYSMMILLSAICGLARSTVLINQNLVIAEYSKEAHVSSAVGLSMVSKGIVILTVGRLIGMYRDYTHNYAMCIFVLNLMTLGTAVSWTIEIILRKAGGRIKNWCTK